MTPLDVLVVESHPGASQHQAEQLRAAGHRVHLCQEPGSDGFPCREITAPGSCPVDGGIDVALLVRRHVAPRPTDREQGIGCVIRAQVPVVEDGPAVLDPYAAYIAERVTDDVVASCEAAAANGYDPMRAAILERMAPLLQAVGHGVSDMACSFTRVGPDLRVHLRGPAMSPDQEQALAVRAMDAINAMDRSYGRIDVGYRSID